MDVLILLQSAPSPWPVWSGYAVCFIPLAAVILGFIIAARFTDKQATSTYRRLDPAKANEPEQ
ncbi:MAG: hypothetical protein HXY39_04225 [Chloroflexi bacterium]|nr:hypothetical protein [Chloroflexota bacterium]